MRSSFSFILAGSALAVAACSQPADDRATANEVNAIGGSADNMMVADNEARASGASTASTARAPVATAKAEARGEASATEAANGLSISFAATGMEPGTYGVHVHAAGRCEGPAFESAGAHWNPTNEKHGRENPQGAHLGDMPNLTVGADGTGRIEFTVPGATLSGGTNAMLDADGAAFMVHARPDDYRTDPSGNSGDRIACGVFDAG